jgi:hypothetical protein
MEQIKKPISKTKASPEYVPFMKKRLDSIESKIIDNEQSSWTKFVGVANKIDDLDNNLIRNGELLNALQTKVDNNQEEILKAVDEAICRSKDQYHFFKRTNKDIESLQKTVSCLVICLSALFVVQLVMFLMR